MWSSSLFFGVANPAAGPPTRGNSATETGSVGMFTCLQGLFCVFSAGPRHFSPWVVGVPGTGLSGGWGDPHHVLPGCPAGRTARAGPHPHPRTSLSPKQGLPKRRTVLQAGLEASAPFVCAASQVAGQRSALITRPAGHRDQMMRRRDEYDVPPGTDRRERLLGSCGPCLALVVQQPMKP